MQEDRTKILGKIKALLETKGCSESEAMARLDKAAELMARYEVSRSEVDNAATDDRYGFRRRPFARKGRSGRVRLPEVAALVRSVSELCDCEALLQDRGAVLSFFGTPLDTEVAHFMVDMLRNVMESSWRHYSRSLEAAEQKARGFHGREIRSSFMMGFAKRVKARIAEIVAAKNATVAATEKGRALIVVKNALVKERYNDVKPEDTRQRAARISTGRGSHAAMAAGEAAGNRVELGARGVGQNGETQRRLTQ